MNSKTTKTRCFQVPSLYNHRETSAASYSSPIIDIAMWKEISADVLEHTASMTFTIDSPENVAHLYFFLKMLETI